MSIERRIIKATSVRATGSGKKLGIEGIAAPFNRYAKIRTQSGMFFERIAPGAFAKTLLRAASGKADPDMACLYNHNPDFVLGRMSNGTLRCEETKDGLGFRCSLPDTSFARDLHASISRRDISGCSFGFNCASDGSDELWDEGFADGLGLDSEDVEDEDPDFRSKRYVRRTLRNFQTVTDVGPVVFPAYNATKVDARSAAIQIPIPETCPAEFRSLILANHIERDSTRRVEAIRQRRRNLVTAVLS